MHCRLHTPFPGPSDGLVHMFVHAPRKWPLGHKVLVMAPEKIAEGVWYFNTQGLLALILW